MPTLKEGRGGGGGGGWVVVTGGGPANKQTSSTQPVFWPCHSYVFKTLIALSHRHWRIWYQREYFWLAIHYGLGQVVWYMHVKGLHTLARGGWPLLSEDISLHQVSMLPLFLSAWEELLASDALSIPVSCISHAEHKALFQFYVGYGKPRHEAGQRSLFSVLPCCFRAGFTSILPLGCKSVLKWGWRKYSVTSYR